MKKGERSGEEERVRTRYVTERFTLSYKVLAVHSRLRPHYTYNILLCCICQQIDTFNHEQEVRGFMIGRHRRQGRPPRT